MQLAQFPHKPGSAPTQSQKIVTESPGLWLAVEEPQQMGTYGLTVMIFVGLLELYKPRPSELCSG